MVPKRYNIQIPLQDTLHIQSSGYDTVPMSRAIKTMLAESCDANNQAKGMAYLNLGWGLGNIVGKLLLVKTSTLCNDEQCHKNQ